ncbi:hypothetical protein [Tropicimonas aquimaris]|uniref:Glycosyl transferases group 1 n=1 Tax=Tropicimonas aquimaris TaxID=914152 RepID=A0ABW3ITH0_9RHOB
MSAELGPVVVHARSSAMFGQERRIAPVLREAIDELHLPLVWDAPQISADVVVFHNPSFLKFQRSFEGRIIARQLVVVTHENFTRPGGAEAFDVAGCLDQIDHATLALRKCLAPISVHNRSTVTEWLAAHPDCAGWEVLDANWFNICDLRIDDRGVQPRDRRGRHSRPTREKFPPLAALDLCFSPRAEANVILGSDFLLNAEVARPHWTMLPFGAIDVGAFLEMIDFHVYFTSPAWRESFGRVIAEALAAGKVVLTDAETGATFGDAVVACQPAEVDAVIAEFLARPELYAEQVRRAGPVLEAMSESAFRARMVSLLGLEETA